jgi:hypothetical protein
VTGAIVWQQASYLQRHGSRPTAASERCRRLACSRGAEQAGAGGHHPRGLLIDEGEDNLKEITRAAEDLPPGGR